MKDIKLNLFQYTFITCVVMIFIVFIKEFISNLFERNNLNDLKKELKDNLHNEDKSIHTHTQDKLKI